MGVIKLPKAHECILPLKWPLKVGTVWECTAKLDSARCRKRWELTEDDGRKVWFPMTPAPMGASDDIKLPEVVAKAVTRDEALYWIIDSLPEVAIAPDAWPRRAYSPAQVLDALLIHYDVVRKD